MEGQFASWQLILLAAGSGAPQPVLGDPGGVFGAAGVAPLWSLNCHRVLGDGLELPWVAEHGSL